MSSTIKFGTASKATPRGRRLYRAGVGFELAINRLTGSSFGTPANTESSPAAGPQVVGQGSGWKGGGGGVPQTRWTADGLNRGAGGDGDVCAQWFRREAPTVARRLTLKLEERRPGIPGFTCKITIAINIFSGWIHHIFVFLHSEVCGFSGDQGAVVIRFWIFNLEKRKMILAFLTISLSLTNRCLGSITI